MLDVMDDDDAETVRRLLSYEEGTAGGLMTPEVIILGPTATVAEALAQIRDPDWVVSIAAQVFVTHAPYKSPTGKFLGVVHVQRLLREPPHMELGRLLDDVPIVPPEISDREVAERLASYDLLAVAVCDEAGRLLGAVTVDDVIDRMLGDGWRKRQRPTRSPEVVAREAPRRSHRAARRTPHRRAVRLRRVRPFSESIANFLGTARFLVWQTVVIIVWIVAQHDRPRTHPVRPVGPRPGAAHPRAVDPGVVRSTADPARPVPPGTTRPDHRRERP